MHAQDMVNFIEGKNEDLSELISELSFIDRAINVFESNHENSMFDSYSIKMILGAGNVEKDLGRICMYPDIFLNMLKSQRSEVQKEVNRISDYFKKIDQVEYPELKTTKKDGGNENGKK